MRATEAATVHLTVTDTGPMVELHAAPELANLTAQRQFILLVTGVQVFIPSLRQLAKSDPIRSAGVLRLAAEARALLVGAGGANE